MIKKQLVLTMVVAMQEGRFLAGPMYSPKDANLMARYINSA